MSSGSDFLRLVVLTDSIPIISPALCLSLKYEQSYNQIVAPQIVEVTSSRGLGISISQPERSPNRMSDLLPLIGKLLVLLHLVEELRGVAKNEHEGCNDNEQRPEAAPVSDSHDGVVSFLELTTQVVISNIVLDLTDAVDIRLEEGGVEGDVVGCDEEQIYQESEGKAEHHTQHQHHQHSSFEEVLRNEIPHRPRCLAFPDEVLRIDALCTVVLQVEFVLGVFLLL